MEQGIESLANAMISGKIVSKNNPYRYNADLYEIFVIMKDEKKENSEVKASDENQDNQIKHIPYKKINNKDYKKEIIGYGEDLPSVEFAFDRKGKVKKDNPFWDAVKKNKPRIIEYCYEDQFSHYFFKKEEKNVDTKGKKHPINLFGQSLAPVIQWNLPAEYVPIPPDENDKNDPQKKEKYDQDCAQYEKDKEECRLKNFNCEPGYFFDLRLHHIANVLRPNLIRNAFFSIRRAVYWIRRAIKNISAQDNRSGAGVNNVIEVPSNCIHQFKEPIKNNLYIAFPIDHERLVADGEFIPYKIAYYPEEYIKKMINAETAIDIDINFQEDKLKKDINGDPTIDNHEKDILKNKVDEAAKRGKTLSKKLLREYFKEIGVQSGSINPTNICKVKNRPLYIGCSCYVANLTAFKVPNGSKKS